MNDQHDPSADRTEPDVTMCFYVFMLVFWPVSIALGLIDFYLVPEHDLRLYNFVAGALAGWTAMQVYRSKQLRRQEAD